MKSFEVVKSNKGSVHYILLLIVVFLVLVGAWTIWQSIQQKTLVQNMSTMLNDYQALVMSKVRNPNDQALLNAKFQAIQGNLSNYGNAFQNIYNQESQISGSSGLSGSGSSSTDSGSSQN